MKKLFLITAIFFSAYVDGGLSYEKFKCYSADKVFLELADELFQKNLDTLFEVFDKEVITSTEAIYQILLNHLENLKTRAAFNQKNDQRVQKKDFQRIYEYIRFSFAIEKLKYDYLIKAQQIRKNYLDAWERYLKDIQEPTDSMSP